GRVAFGIRLRIELRRIAGVTCAARPRARSGRRPLAEADRGPRLLEIDQVIAARINGFRRRCALALRLGLCVLSTLGGEAPGKLLVGDIAQEGHARPLA